MSRSSVSGVAWIVHWQLRLSTPERARRRGSSLTQSFPRPLLILLFTAGVSADYVVFLRRAASSCDSDGLYTPPSPSSNSHLLPDDRRRCELGSAALIRSNRLRQHIHIAQVDAEGNEALLGLAHFAMTSRLRPRCSAARWLRSIQRCGETLIAGNTEYQRIAWPSTTSRRRSHAGAWVDVYLCASDAIWSERGRAGCWRWRIHDEFERRTICGDFAGGYLRHRSLATCRAARS